MRTHHGAPPLMQEPGVRAPGLWVEGTGSSLAAAPVPSLTDSWAPPPLWSARLGLCLGDGRLDAGRPEGDPAAVVHGPGLGDQAGDLDRVALADAGTGQAGHLDSDDLGRPVGHGDELHHVERLAVLVGPGPPRLEIDHRLGLDRAQERNGRGVHWELHALPPSPDDPAWELPYST